MSARSKLWIIASALYLAFFAWYTDFRPPLSDQEVDQFIATKLAGGSDPEVIYRAEKLFRNDTGRQFLMINAMDYNENPGPVEGAKPGETAEDLLARYLEHMLPAMLARASHPVIMGEVYSTSFDLAGIENAEVWDSGSIFRYRSRRTLFDIVSNPEFAGQHHFKHAAISKTIAFPIETQLYIGDLRFILGLMLLTVTALLDAWVFSRKR